MKISGRGLLAMGASSAKAVADSGCCSGPRNFCYLTRKLPVLEFEQLVSSRNRKSGWPFRTQLNNKHHRKDSMDKKLATVLGIPVDDNWNIATAGKRGPASLQNIWFVNKMALFDREVISERRMHASVDDGRTNLKEVGHAEVRC